MWPDYHSAFPDWLDETEKTTEWWIQEFVDFHKQVKRHSLMVIFTQIDSFHLMAFGLTWMNRKFGQIFNLKRDHTFRSAFGTNEAEPWYWKPDAFIPDKPHIKGLRCPLDSKLDFPPYQTINVYQHQNGDKVLKWINVFYFIWFFSKLDCSKIHFVCWQKQHEIKTQDYINMISMTRWEANNLF